MKTLILDIETTFQKDGNKSDPSPYNHLNYIVSAGVIDVDTGVTKYVFYQHDEGKSSLADIQAFADEVEMADLIVGHNLKFDISWLRECGFKIKAKLWDTMVFEYILAKGQKPVLSLKNCALKHGLTPKRDILAEYIDKGLNVNQIPKDKLEEYGVGDLLTTLELYNLQKELYNSNPEVITMRPAIDLSMEVTNILIDMERAGLHIDTDTLDKVEKEYRAEYDALEARLNEIVVDVMGHRKVNLSSPEQLSWIIYSRKVLDKKKWAEIFNIGTELRGSVLKVKRKKHYPKDVFASIVRNNMVTLSKQEAEQCGICLGKGTIQKIKKNGENFKKETKCYCCSGAGFTYKDLDEIAGFKIQPLGAMYTTTGGFASDKEAIKLLLQRHNLPPAAREFLTTLLRFSSVQTYLNTYVDSIRRGTKPDSLLHATFNQCLTATGRLSSSNPNSQNWPRERTFPIRKVITSRFVGGKILDVDLAQLEFRTAAMLSGCSTALQDILDNVDVHSFTAKVLTDAGQTTDRQTAKSHCFPLDTKILTPDGFKDYTELKIGDKVINYDAVNNILVEDIIVDYTSPHKQEVIKMQTKHNWVVKSTPEHRWYCTKRTDGGNKGRSYLPCVVFTKDIHSEHRIITSAKYASIGSLSTTEAAILAWLWTDGCENPHDSTIIQKKFPDVIRNLLQGYKYSERLGVDGCYTFRISQKDIQGIYNKIEYTYNTVDYSKVILSLSSEARKSWLNAVCLAEGTKRKNGEWRIAQNSGELCEAIKLAGFLEGFDVRTTKVIMKYNGKQHEQITLRTRPFVTGQRILKKSLGIKDVWCVTTNNRTVVIKQGDTISISGNTFKPLYGGMSGTEAEVTYYTAFLDKYSGIKKWHTDIVNEVLATGQFQIPSGRIYKFDNVRRLDAERVSGKTQIVNYPVQGFATGDIIWCIIRDIYNRMKGLKSKLILQVHDSIMADVHPDEVDEVIDIFNTSFSNANILIEQAFNFKTPVPVGFEMKIGDNAMETKKI